MTKRTTAVSDALVVACPHCGKSREVEMDFEPGEQRFVEDCEVCCHPMEVVIHFDQHDGHVSAHVERT